MKFISLDSQPEADAFWALYVQKAGLFEEYTHFGAISTVPKSVSDWYWVESGKKVKINLKWEVGQPEGGDDQCMCVRKSLNSYSLFDLRCYDFAFKFLCQSTVTM
jgi:hypothetical protein